MINILSICLQAIHRETNLFRQYEVHAGKDLFGMWVLTLAYGRIGKASQIRTYAFSDSSDLVKMIRKILKKRLRSARRIGTNYFLQDFSQSKNISDERILSFITEIKK